MADYTELMNRIKKHEGFVNKIYKDSLGKATIGFGHLVTKHDKFEEEGKRPIIMKNYWLQMIKEVQQKIDAFTTKKALNQSKKYR